MKSAAWAAAARAAWLFGYAAWVGGFFFYSAVVVHVQQARVPDIAPGDAITRPVTWWLNGIGVAVLAGWWLEWALAAPRRPRLLGALLAFSTVCQASLLALHGRVGAAWDAGSDGFYGWHQVYLGVHTAQFFAHLALLAAALWRWRRHDRAAGASAGGA